MNLIMPISLTKVERLILVQQFRILSLLEPEKKGTYEQKSEILSHGFVSHYDDVFDDGIANEFADEDAEFVCQVLRMFTAIQYSYDNVLTQSEREGIPSTSFPGFDSIAEAPYLSYARLLMSSGS